MQTLLQDIRYALRQLRKSPGFTLTAVLTLALGIGANTAIFTLVHGILLRSLPVTDPAQLYRIGDNGDCCVDGGFPGDASDTGDFSIFSYDLYQYLKNAAPEFQPLAAVQAGQWRWTVRRGNALPTSLHGEFVSGNYFTTLGLGAYAGRMFTDGDDTPNAAPATVLSYKAWQGEYAADPSIIGSTVFIQARPFTVIGVAPPGFFGDRVTDSPPISGCRFTPSPMSAEKPAPSFIILNRTGSIRWAESAQAPTSAPCKPSSPACCANGSTRAPCLLPTAEPPSFPKCMSFFLRAAAASRTCNRKQARA